MSRQTGDMDAIRHFVAYPIYAIYENTLLFVIALVMVFIVDYRLALCMIAVMPLTVFFNKKLLSVKPAFQNIRQHFSNLNTFVQENISGNRVVTFAKKRIMKLLNLTLKMMDLGCRAKPEIWKNTFCI